MGNLLVSWALMAALYVVYMRGYSTPDKSRLTRFEYRRRVGDRFGLLPPSREPLGMLLWLVTVIGFFAAIVFVVAGVSFVGAASSLMVGSFLLTLWRDDRWIKRQQDYQDALKATRSPESSDETDS